jgi:RNA polymerase sigma factor (TIGR02999 family)
MSEITELLDRIAAGNKSASEQLLPLVYDELRQIAAQKLNYERSEQTLQATALVHETYVRLFGNDTPIVFEGRRHFFAVAATAMRRILIDSARKKLAQKRGAGMRKQSLQAVGEPKQDDQLLALDAALKKLELIDPQKSKLVELRYFGGLTGDQIAAVLGISPTTVDRYWSYAKAWLRAEMGDCRPD